MANNDQPYDPYIPSGRGTPGPNTHHEGGNDRTAALQAQIDDTVNVMRQNIQRTEERGGRVADLDHQTRKLADSSADFKRGTNRVRKQLMWKNVRMWVWILVGIAVLIIIIALCHALFITGTARNLRQATIDFHQAPMIGGLRFPPTMRASIVTHIAGIL
ncbi:MAG: hypothetical protein Q9186_003908 [Xanthomendoza sp. 1 TL-2023]